MDLVVLIYYDKKLLSEIIKNQETSLLEIKKYLINLQNKNVSQDELYSFLEKLRSDAETEIEEDYILEIMDLVCGWCSLDLQIYPQK
mgnify:CR=1 FL=1